jgi:hypothetical protein
MGLPQRKAPDQAWREMLASCLKGCLMSNFTDNAIPVAPALAGKGPVHPMHFCGHECRLPG